MKVTENSRLHKNYCLLKLTSADDLPEMLPGQFVEVRVENSPTTFLRRPISINFVDQAKNELWLLIQLVGDGTRKMAEFRPGDLVNIILPLGNGFTIPSKGMDKKLLLIGGGVGTAPMLYLGACLKEAGFEPVFQPFFDASFRQTSHSLSAFFAPNKRSIPTLEGGISK